ncbi:MAG: hypothetical protein LBN25_04555 [Christensenellaceae bacterium]|jgi:ABC-type sugar transport system ATPase subunit|nr:hypothetical protein [Christensenellaceae bacterium]
MVLEVKNLIFKYPYGEIALDGVSFTADENGLAVFSKPKNGKTTLLNCLAGLTIPLPQGEILLDGESVFEKKLKDRDVCLMREDGGLNKYRTARHCLSYPLKIRKFPKNEIYPLVTESAKTFNCEHMLFDLCKNLDADDVCRLALARALVRAKSGAKLILIDNIFNVMKEYQRREVFEELKQPLLALRNCGAVVIFATDSEYEASVFKENGAEFIKL